MENQNRGRLLEESIRAKKEEQETLTPVNVLLALLYLPFYVTFGLIRSIPSILFWLCQGIRFVLIAALCGAALGLEKLFSGKAGEISWEQRRTARVIATALLSTAIFVLSVYVWGWLWGRERCASRKNSSAAVDRRESSDWRKWAAKRISCSRVSSP